MKLVVSCFLSGPVIRSCSWNLLEVKCCGDFVFATRADCTVLLRSGFQLSRACLSKTKLGGCVTRTDKSYRTLRRHRSQLRLTSQHLGALLRGSETAQHFAATHHLHRQGRRLGSARNQSLFSNREDVGDMFLRTTWRSNP
jgi:hypothetical protein